MKAEWTYVGLVGIAVLAAMWLLLQEKQRPKEQRRMWLQTVACLTVFVGTVYSLVVANEKYDWYR